MRWAACLLLAGCNLVNTNTFSVSYSFDPEEYQKSFGATMGTFPAVACDPSTADCSQANAALMGSSFTATCDGTARQCKASGDLRLSYPVNLSMQSSFPPEAIEFGINFVTIEKVKYWVVNNTLTIDTPAIDLYVAPATAKDETMGTKLGSIAPLHVNGHDAAGHPLCNDTADSDDKSMGSNVCDMQLEKAGVDALANFAKDYKNEFQIIAHAVVTAKGGDPLPAGMLDFVVRPVIDIGIVK
jgi:hypothetical protein